ncbi:MAG: arsenite efflux transporter metallochaperone ArsD [Rhodobacteraceae bacterium]|nr:arsenite efflux transporter metallochaperone ArsD [Paracoccaceae bacterium]
MKPITVYDPAMCCSTGICGAEVDQTLVNFAADLDWLKSQGVTVTRINLSQDPAAFAANEAVKAVLESSGVDGLPVVMSGDQLQSSGRYLTRSELATLAGIACTPDSAEPKASSGCCGGDTSVEKTASDCC